MPRPSNIRHVAGLLLAGIAWCAAVGVIVALAGTALLLVTEDGQRLAARLYARHVMSEGQVCPANLGHVFWFECDAERRVVHDLPPPPALPPG